jgi:hypothetical protein
MHPHTTKQRRCFWTSAKLPPKPASWKASRTALRSFTAVTQEKVNSSLVSRHQACEPPAMAGALGVASRQRRRTAKKQAPAGHHIVLWRRLESGAPGERRTRGILQGNQRTCKSGNGPCWTKCWTFCWSLLDSEPSTCPPECRFAMVLSEAAGVCPAI